MKKLLLVMLFVFTNITSAQDTTQGEQPKGIFASVKSSLADQTILFGSFAIVAGGCFVGRKQLGGLVWVTKKHFDKKISELVVAVHGVRTDIMQAKSHLHSRIEELVRDVKDGFGGVHDKLGAQSKQLDDLSKQVENLQKDVTNLGEQVPAKLVQLQASAHSLRAEIGAVASDVKSLHAKLDALDKHFISKKP